MVFLVDLEMVGGALHGVGVFMGYGDSIACGLQLGAVVNVIFYSHVVLSVVMLT